VVLEVTAKDGDGKVFFDERKNWFEIGVDTDRDMRYGAWQIKEVIDLTLPPLQTEKERFIIHFDTETDEGEIEARLWYYISGAKGDIIYSVKRKFKY